jgi:drug/metabolite transporter (DMT)-like permease
VIASKASFADMGPFFQGLVRFSLATVVFFVLLAVRGSLAPLRGRDLIYTAATGLLGISLYFVGENLGIKLLPASTSSLIVGAFPALALALECVWDHTRPVPHKAVGIALAFVGAGILAVQESANGGSNVVAGTAALLFAGLCWAIYNIMMRPLVGRHSTLVITAWQTLVGAIGFVPFALAEGLPASMPSVPTLFSLAYLVLGCTVAGFMLYNFGLKELSASTASALVNLIPVFGLILSALILGEQITVAQVVGGVVVLVGIALSARV